MNGLLVAALALLSPQQVSSLLETPSKTQVDALMMSQPQTTEAVLDAAGNYTWTFPIPFVAPPRVAYFPRNPDITGKPIVCNYQTLTATSITFHCDKSPGVLVNLLTPVFDRLGAAGATVSVTARGTLAVMPTNP